MSCMPHVYAEDKIIQLIFPMHTVGSAVQLSLLRICYDLHLKHGRVI